MKIGFDKPRQAQFRHLGPVLYGAGLRMQRALAEHVRQGGRPDQIIFLEHNHVYTLGSSATRGDIHVSDGFLADNGIEVHRIDRGGQVTYHGPGQIVVYPICNLREGRQSVGRFIRGLEQAMIDTAGDFGVEAGRLDGFPGAWAKTVRGMEKVGAIGVHLSRWVSTHGIAFNFDPDMTNYDWITPCGIPDKGVCSLRSILGDRCPSRADAEYCLARHISELLALDPVPASKPSESISATVWRHGDYGPEVLIMLRSPSEGVWWSSVTGMVEPGETYEDAAIRETMEECGLVGKLCSLDFQHTFWIDPELTGIQNEEPQFNLERCFHIQVPANARVTLNTAEHSEYRWCSPEEAMELMAWEGSKGVLKKLMRVWTS